MYYAAHVKDEVLFRPWVLSVRTNLWMSINHKAQRIYILFIFYLQVVGPATGRWTQNSVLQRRKVAQNWSRKIVLRPEFYTEQRLNWKIKFDWQPMAYTSNTKFHLKTHQSDIWKKRNKRNLSSTALSFHAFYAMNVIVVFCEVYVS